MILVCFLSFFFSAGTACPCSEDSDEKCIKKNPKPIEDVSTLKQRIRELEQSLAESRQIEEALRESEVKYRLAFESTSDGIFTIDTNFNISSITPSVERQLGYKVEELINRPCQ